MINPADLRIGNVVSLIDISKYIHIPQGTFKIMSVDLFEVTLCPINVPFYKVEDRIKASMRGVGPIGITKEWLLNTGFTECNHPHHYYKDDFIIFINDGAVVSMPIGAYYVSVDATFGIMEIKYLHQLQNLFFALTGNEIEFKTPDK